MDRTSKTGPSPLGLGYLNGWPFGPPDGCPVATPEGSLVRMDCGCPFGMPYGSLVGADDGSLAGTVDRWFLGS